MSVHLYVLGPLMKDMIVGYVHNNLVSQYMSIGPSILNLSSKGFQHHHLACSMNHALYSASTIE